MWVAAICLGGEGEKVKKGERIKKYELVVSYKLIVIEMESIAQGI